MSAVIRLGRPDICQTLVLAKLAQLVSATAMEASLLIGMVSACTALVASIVGPIVALNEPALLEKFERIVLAQAKIQLLINPNEENHQRLTETIDAAIRRLRSEAALDSETEADLRTIVALAQAILKREWQRVKLGT